MGIGADSRAISSIWSGHYWLGTDAVRFTAWLTLKNGKLTGTTLEPTFACFDDAGEHEAAVRGHVNEDEVAFLKTYKSFDHEPAYYEGQLSDDGRQIIGRWYFGWPDEASGAFELNLKNAQTEETQELLARIQSDD